MKIPRTNLRLNRENIKCVFLSHGLWKFFKKCRRCGGKLILDSTLPYDLEYGILWENMKCVKCGGVTTKEVLTVARD